MSSFAATESADAPYVIRGEHGLEAWSTEIIDGVATKRVVAVTTGSRITIAAVGAVPAFEVALRAPAQTAPQIVKTGSSAPLFVVADTHGEYEILAQLLQRHHIIDSALRWSFGRGQFVILGDVFDRGPYQTEILWLLYKIEAEARRAGGALHLVLGNHEVMILQGDLRYLNPKYTRTAAALGVSSYSQLFAPDSVLGRWLRSKPAVLKLNDLLCLHGGISRAAAERKLTLAQINATVRNTLSAATPLAEGADEERARFVMGQLGPLWYRGYFAAQTNFPTATSTDVDQTLHRFGVTTILVGHTVVPTITPLYGGRVIAVQVYPHRDEKSGLPIMEALRIENGRFLRARIDGSLELLDVESPAAIGDSAAPSSWTATSSPAHRDVSAAIRATHQLQPHASSPTHPAKTAPLQASVPPPGAKLMRHVGA